jgi:hypothetical protein
VLVEALLAGDVENGKVHLPEPFAAYTLNLQAFDPSRTFKQAEREAMVL